MQTPWSSSGAKVSVAKCRNLQRCRSVGDKRPRSTSWQWTVIELKNPFRGNSLSPVQTDRLTQCWIKDLEIQRERLVLIKLAPIPLISASFPNLNRDAQLTLLHRWTTWSWPHFSSIKQQWNIVNGFQNWEWRMRKNRPEKQLPSNQVDRRRRMSDVPFFAFSNWISQWT